MSETTRLTDYSRVKVDADGNVTIESKEPGEHYFENAITLYEHDEIEGLMDVLIDALALKRASE